MSARAMSVAVTAVHRVPGNYGRTVDPRCRCVFAAVRPTTRDPTSPGLVATAIAPIASSPTPALRNASSTTGKSCRTCSREAISGTTPPNRSCSST